MYGHIHGNSEDVVFKFMYTRGVDGARALNAGVCINNYTPVSIEEMIDNNKNHFNNISREIN